MCRVRYNIIKQNNNILSVSSILLLSLILSNVRSCVEAATATSSSVSTPVSSASAIVAEAARTTTTSGVGATIPGNNSNNSRIKSDHHHHQQQQEPSQPNPTKQRMNNNKNDAKDEIFIVFSDVDGTLVHYPSDDDTIEKADDIKASDDKDDGGENNNKIIELPSSSTGMKGIISSKTLRLVQEIRKQNQQQQSKVGSKAKSVKFVLVSGMRTTTLFKRLPSLPKADAYCSENGGRIFYPIDSEDDDDGSSNTSTGKFLVTPVSFDGGDKKDLEPFHIVEDMEWRQRMEENYTGPYNPKTRTKIKKQKTTAATDDDTSSSFVLQNRNGLLWDYAKSLISNGFVLDVKGYSSCFRVNLKQQNFDNISKEDFDKLAKGEICPPYEGITSSINLSCIDYYPISSGKKNCCKYLIRKFLLQSNEDKDDNEEDKLKEEANKNKVIDSIDDDHNVDVDKLMKTNAVCLCDDDNDLEMAYSCQHAYIPGISSSSMYDAIQTNPKQFTLLPAARLMESTGTSKSQSDDDSTNNSVNEREGTTTTTELALEMILERIKDKM